MNQIAKKGDMAVIVGMQYATEMNGRIVPVLSDPQIAPTICVKTGELLPPNLCNRVDLGRGRLVYDCVATHCLIPIRDPDADVTRTTDREVAA